MEMQLFILSLCRSNFNKSSRKKSISRKSSAYNYFDLKAHIWRASFSLPSSTLKKKKNFVEGTLFSSTFLPAKVSCCADRYLSLERNGPSQSILRKFSIYRRSTSIEALVKGPEPTGETKSLHQHLCGAHTKTCLVASPCKNKIKKIKKNIKKSVIVSPLLRLHLACVQSTRGPRMKYSKWLEPVTTLWFTTFVPLARGSEHKRYCYFSFISCE
ncbi:hypothetical protein PUN28_014934 [Cardiocondyla obscurior]|uniref:Uncharacterized protein n=1 Tax=Cardiocondyla obscurior TaxID=286306 RepID=A0AAW2F0K3_9HYME